MSSPEEKIFEQLWDHVRPFVNITRVLELILLFAAVSSSSEKLFNTQILDLPLSNFAAQTKDVLANVTLWKAITAGILVFIFAPLSSIYTIRVLINKWHIRFAQTLISATTLNLNKSSEIEGGRSASDLLDLLERKKTGMQKFNSLRNLSEVSTLGVFALIFVTCIYESIKFDLYIGAIIAWLLALYLLSQKMMVIYLTHIYPANAVVTSGPNV
jgi:hypothetical protein